LFAGRIVSADTAAEMLRPRSEPANSMRYGLGFWIYDPTEAVSLHRFDAGVGFVSVRDPGGRFAFTVLCDKGREAWPVGQRLNELVASLT
jgi:hypothetical protein